MDCKYVGIDISKNDFNLSFYNENGKFVDAKFTYSKKDLTSMKKLLPQNCICVMEATGHYYLRLAYFLTENQINLSVVNPLIIRRYAQMKMMRAKTDKADARVICKYGIDQKPELWKPKDIEILKLRDIYSVMDKLIRDRASWMNKHEAAKHNKYFDLKALKKIKMMISFLTQQIEEMQEELENLALKHFEDQKEILTSIPGIGNKTAIMLIVITNGFKNFEDVRQLVAYVGLAPRIYTSGISVKGKPKICKLGMSKIRQLLYMCTWTAIKANAACKNLYKRLIEGGKKGKVALIAVANKLLRQAFGCIKNNTKFKVELSF